jgi:hypothetical protein
LDGRAAAVAGFAVMDAHPLEHWREVNYLEFDRYLREYPRPLVADPPLNRPARLREWFDIGLGVWPHNAVAKQLDVHNRSYLVRDLSQP